MAEQVIFGKTDKRLNSISQQYTPVITTNVLLKEPCSIVAPTFLVKQPYATMRECNYCEYAGFYYWIDDIISLSNKHVQVKCSRDPLASFKDEIKKTEAFIAYGSSALKDKNLLDPRMSPEIIADSTIRNKELVEGLFDRQGTIVLRTYAMLDANTSGVRTYFLNLNTFKRFLTSINQTIRSDLDSAGTTVFDAIKRIACSILASGSIKDQILDCYWVPTKYSYFAEYPDSEIALGAYLTKIKAKEGNGFFENKVSTDYEFDIPKPDFFNNYPWLKHPQYFSVQLNHPGGMIDISSPEFIYYDKLYCNYVYTMDTGDYIGTIKLQPGHQKMITIFGGSFRYDLLGRVKASGDTLASMGGTAISMAGGIFGNSFRSGKSVTHYHGLENDEMTTGQKIEKGIDKVGSAVVQASGVVGEFMNTGPKVSGGSIAISANVLGLYLDGDTDWSNAIYISCVGSIPKIIGDSQYENFCDKYGYLVQNYAKLELNEGYCQCVAASANIAGATPAELSAINFSINSGIYIED